MILKIRGGGGGGGVVPKATVSQNGKLLQLHLPQAQRVADHRNRAETHRRRCDDWTQQQSELGIENSRRNRNSDRVVYEREEQVLLDVAHDRFTQSPSA